MTTYRYKLDLNSSEIEVIRKSLEMMQEFSEEMIKNGKSVPYYSDILNCRTLKDKLYEHKSMGSTNNFNEVNQKKDWMKWLKQKVDSLKGS